MKRSDTSVKYFDFAATCPIDDEALQAYVKASKSYFGNTSSPHDTGSQASALVEECRDTLATMTGVQKEGLYFTSGGTESNFIAIYALLSAKKKKGNHIIISQSEHASIQNVISKLEGEGYSVTKIPLTPEGIIDVDALQKAMTEDTVLVSVQHVNPEIGTIQPLAQIKQICKDTETYLHSDCVQSFGKVDLREVTPYLDSYSVSSHKVYGPKGVGAVYINPVLSPQPYFPNGTHERGIRPGTLNVPGIVGFTVAAQAMDQKLESNRAHYLKLYQTFMNSIESAQSHLDVLPSSYHEGFSAIVGLCVKGIEGQWMMLEANRKGFSFSTGSACSAGNQTPSKTLLAMGVPEEEAKSFIRISFGKDQTEEDVTELAQLLVQTVQERHQLVLE